MTENCEYCKAPFRGERRTKKYCSDNCRQMAYLSRKGYLTNSVDSLKQNLTVNSVKPDVKDIFSVNNIKDIKYSSDVKHGNDVKDSPNVKDATEMHGVSAELGGVTPIRKLNEKINALEATVTQQNNLLLSMWTNIKADCETTRLTVINEIHKQFSKHNPFWRGFNGIDYCAPCNTKTISPTAVKIEIPQETENKTKQKTKSSVGVNLNKETNTPHLVNGIQKEPGLCNETEDEETNVDHEPTELELAQQRIKELEEKLKHSETSSTEQEPTEPETTEIGRVALNERITEDQQEDGEAEETEYEWRTPDLYIQIENKLEKGDASYHFQNAIRHWGMDDAQKVMWVNARLRIMLDSLVRLSLRSYTNYDTIQALGNAFISLSNSEDYRDLPHDYPYTNLIAELTDSLRNIGLNYVTQTRAPERIPVWMGSKRKSTLIAACIELQSTTEKLKFSELDFAPAIPYMTLSEKTKELLKEENSEKLKSEKKASQLNSNEAR